MIGNIEKFFEPGFSVWRAGNVPDAWGGNVPTHSVHIAALSGRLRPLSGDMRMSADKDTFFGTHRLYCFPADILPGDEIRWGARRFKVNAASDMMSMARLMQVELEEVL